MNKRILIAVLLAVLTVGQAWANDWSDYRAENFVGGDGSAEDPYQIATAEQLALLAYLINNNNTNFSYRDKHFSITADISLDKTDQNGKVDWVPIGNSLTFYGTVRGNGHTISGMTIGRHQRTGKYLVFRRIDRYC